MSPIYQWKKDGVNVGTNSPVYTSAIAGGEQIKCEMSSSVVCATPVPAVSNQLNMTVSPITNGSVSMYVANDSVACEGEAFVFTSYFTNGGTTPSFRWFNNGIAIPGANQAVYASSTLSNNDIITVEMSSSNACVFPVMANPIQVEVIDSETPSVKITGKYDFMGYTFYSNFTNGGPAPTYQWRKNNVDIPGATGDTYVAGNLIATDKITLAAASSLECAFPKYVQSNSITVSEVTGVKTVANTTDNIRLFPNPNDGKFTIKGSVKAANIDVTVEVLNAVGQVVYKNTVPVHAAEFTTDINLGSNAVAGMYLVRVNIDGNMSAIRFIVK
jgi:hypothetical protein